MPTELEMKYSLPDAGSPSADDLAEAFAGTDLAIEPRPTVRHADRYYDDPRLSLSRAGVALRRRIGGGKVVATLKTRGRVLGAMHEREEIELPMEGREWPEAIHERISRITEPAALKGRFELETERLRFMVLGNPSAGQERGELAEISVDRVEATRPTGGRSVAFRELEIEDCGGGPEALERIAARIGTVVALRPSAETKLERARRMLMSGDPE